MSEPALKIVETTEVETKALSIVDQAKAVKVVDAETYLKAGALWSNIKDMIAEVKAAFDPICDTAFKAHKAATKKRAEFLDPLEAVYKSVKGLKSDYDAAQERIRLSEQRRLEEEARKIEDARRAEELQRLEEERKAEEERFLQAAIEAEGKGYKDQANELVKMAEEKMEEIKQEAAVIIQEPVRVAPIVMPKAVPKIAGGPVYQTRWDFEITNVNLIPRNYMIPDLVKIRNIVTDLKDQANIPGIRCFSKRV